MSNPNINALGNNGGRLYSFGSQPVLIDCNFTVSNSSASGTSSVKGQGVQNVFMYSTAGAAATAIGNPLTSSTYSQGMAIIQLSANYARYLGGFSGVISPTTGSAIAINSTSLNVGQAYVIASVGTPANGAVTIAPVADVSGSLASSWLNLYDGYGQSFALWLQVGGVGTAPTVPGSIVVPVAIATNATASAITTALSAVISNLASPVTGVYSFTCSGGGTATLTVTSTAAGPLAGPPSAGSITGTPWTFATTVSNTNLQCWQGVGLPKGLVPTVGQSFIATASGVSSGGGSSGTVLAAGTSGILSVELIGDPNQSFAPVPQGGSPNVGGYLLVQFMSAGSGNAAPVVTQPKNNSVIEMSFYVDQRSNKANTNAGTKL